jgi:hypothetical protein
VSYRDEPETSEAYDDGPVERSPRRDRDRQTIDARLDRLGKHLAMIAEAVDRSEGVFGPVLRPPRPTPALAGGGSHDDDSSALAERIEQSSAQAYALGRRLAELLDRVDL